MLKIFVFRHGETDANVLDLCQGNDMDYPLNEKGLEQADVLGNKLKGENLEIIISSPLQRAKQTAEAVAAPNNTPIEFMDDLREGCMGIAQKKSMVWFNENYSEISKARFDIKDPMFWDAAIPEMESRRDVQIRIRKALENIKRNYSQYEKVGIATHGFFMQSMYLELFGEFKKMADNSEFFVAEI